MVYYSPSEDGAYEGVNYYFRDDELLYARSASSSEIVFGEHYFEYIAELKFDLAKIIAEDSAWTLLQTMYRMKFGG